MRARARGWGPDVRGRRGGGELEVVLAVGGLSGEEEGTGGIGVMRGVEWGSSRGGRWPGRCSPALMADDGGGVCRRGTSGGGFELGVGA